MLKNGNNEVKIIESPHTEFQQNSVKEFMGYTENLILFLYEMGFSVDLLHTPSLRSA
jgi:hypothetical protein